MDKLLKIYETMIIGLKKYHGSMQERHIGETQTRGNKDIKNEIKINNIQLKTIQKTKLCLKKKCFVIIISLQYMYIYVHIHVPLIEIKFHTPITTV